MTDFSTTPECTNESNSKRKTILLLGATFDTDNMGVGALAAGAITALMHHHPDAQILFLDYGRVPSRTEVQISGKCVSIALVNLRFSWRILMRNNVAYLLLAAALLRVLPDTLGRRLVNGNRWLTAIRGANYAVAISGGDSFSDIYGISRFLYVTLPQFLLVLLRKPYTLLPQTIGPFDTGFARALAGFLMQRAQLVFSRDSAGVLEASALMKLSPQDPKVRFCHDLGFLLQPESPHSTEPWMSDTGPRERPLVGLNVSGLMLIGGYSRDNAFGLRIDYRRLVHAIVELLIRTRGADVLLVPHVFGREQESDTTAAAAIFRELSARYEGRLLRVAGTYNQGEIKHIIAQCDFFVGARMHACIAALSQGIPTVAIAYSRKFIGVLESIDAGSYVADPRTMDEDQILRLIDNTFQNRAAIHATLRDVMPRVRGALLETARDFVPTSILHRP